MLPALLLVASHSAAQITRTALEDAVAVEAATATVAAGLDLTIASLQARVKKLESAQPAPDDSTAEALREYAAAVEQLQLAAQWKQRAEGLARLQKESAGILSANRRELEAWSKPAPPVVTEQTPQTEVEAMLAETEARLGVVRKGLLDLDAEQAKLAERRLSLPAEIAAAGATREGTLGEIDLPPLPTGSVEASVARRAAALARQKASAEQAAALELELTTHEVRRELVTARRELLRRKSDSYAARVTELQAALAERRVREAEKTAAEARSDQAALARVHPILGRLAEENARLAAERTGPEGLSARIDATSRQLTLLSEQLQQLEERSKGVHQKVAAAGLTDAIGLLLRKERSALPDVDRIRAEMRARRAEISNVQFKTLSLEDLLKALPGVESEVEEILRTQEEKLAGDERARIEASSRNVLRTRRSYLDALIRDYNSWFASLVDLDARAAQLVKLLEDYTAFLDQHVLWVPNASLTGFANPADWQGAAIWLVDPGNYANAGRRLLAGANASPIATLGGAVAMILAIVYRRRLKRMHVQACETGMFLPAPGVPAAVAALLLGVLLALPGPFAVWLLGWTLGAAAVPPDDFSRALSSALRGLAFPLFAFEFLRRAVGSSGPAAGFLAWPRTALASLRTQIVFVETTTLPAFFVASVLDAQPEDDWSETLGRAVFCLGVGAAGLAAHRLFSNRGLLVDQILRRTDLEWLGPMLSRMTRMPMVIAGLIIGIALIGYYYTAFVLLDRIWLSTLVLLVFIVANAAALRWLAAKQAAAPREALEVAADAEATEEAGGLSAAEAISQVSAQTRSLLRVVFGVGLLVGLFSVWVNVFPALRFFEKIELWHVTTVIEKTVGTGDAVRVEQVPQQVPVTVANLMLAILGAALAVVGARNLPGLIELVLLSRLRLDKGLRYAIAAVTRYLVFVVGSVVALRNLGVQWANVQWLVAAVSVGLGFGLQEIFGNFVSGLIVLFERPVRVGDTVTIDGSTGVISRIEMRATTLIDSDRKELIVPNKQLITGKLVNLSRHDPIVRVVVQVRVAYGSDLAVVERLLHEAAKNCAYVLETPPPGVACLRFGDSALEFELRVSVANAEARGPARHDLLMSIERKLRGAGIEIPVTGRDVHVKSIDAAVAASLAPPREEPA